MKTLVFFLEEPSAKEMLKGILERMLPDTVKANYIVFEGKQDLEGRLSRYLRAWKKPDCRFVVMRDQDSGDCHLIKSNLAELCRQGGKPQTLIRIACRELESFYFGDLPAVEKGLEIQGLSRHERKRKYRVPDDICQPSRELGKLTDNRYRKVAGSRAIGRHLSLNDNKSHSFNVLISGIRSLIEAT